MLRALVEPTIGSAQHLDELAEVRRHSGYTSSATASTTLEIVSELIRSHATNREIANQLFLSLKSVETHIRNIFNKLGVTSRAEIARTLTAQSP